MKTIIKTLILSCGVMLASCDNNYHCGMKTIVNEDGTLSREFTLHLDSAQLVSGKLDAEKNMVVLDRAWQLSWALKGDSLRHQLPMAVDTYRALKQRCKDDNQDVNDTIVVYATRTFDHASVMGQNTQFKVGALNLSPVITLEKDFRFFYTTYRLKEIYRQPQLHFPVPLSRYFTKEEMGYWFSGTPNLGEGLSGMEVDDITQQLKRKYSRWIAANDFELTYKTILDNYSKTGLGPKDRARFVALHDSLLAAFSHVNTLEEFHEDKSTWFEKRLHTDAYSRVIDDKQLMAKVEELENTFVALLLFDVDYQVEMPSGNQPKEEVHRLTGTRLIAADVQLESTSVRRHTLAYAFTLFLLLGAIAGGWILHHKRKRL